MKRFSPPIWPIAVGLALASAGEGVAAVQAVAAGERTKALAAARKTVISGKAGAWGRLEYYHIHLEAPESLLQYFPLPNTQTCWTFPGATAESLRDLFLASGIATNLADKLLAGDRLTAVDGVARVHPSLEELEAMSATSRAAIYQELARHADNVYHQNPLIINSGDADEWLAGANLNPAVARHFKRLLYQRGQAPLFSDVPALLGLAESMAEAQRLFKLLTRTRTMVARLKIDPGMDLKRIADYWTTGFGKKDKLPILESLADLDGQVGLDIVHLLPPLPRKLLYTHPPVELAVAGRMPDCHWTSFNFFNYTPQAIYLDTRLASSAVIKDYAQREAPYGYGDVLFFVDSRGEAVHSCVYLADDIVFTKNGENVLSPWVLMTLQEVSKVYLLEAGGEIQAFRRKGRE